MRALMIGCTLALAGALPVEAQTARDAKAAPATSDVRYFNSLGDILGELPVDAFIRHPLLRTPQRITRVDASKVTIE